VRNVAQKEQLQVHWLEESAAASHQIASLSDQLRALREQREVRCAVGEVYSRVGC
jgi:hypothetical protein